MLWNKIIGCLGLCWLCLVSLQAKDFFVDGENDLMVEPGASVIQEIPLNTSRRPVITGAYSVNNRSTYGVPAPIAVRKHYPKSQIVTDKSSPSIDHPPVAPGYDAPIDRIPAGKSLGIDYDANSARTTYYAALPKVEADANRASGDDRPQYYWPVKNSQLPRGHPPLTLDQRRAAIEHNKRIEAERGVREGDYGRGNAMTDVLNGRDPDREGISQRVASNRHYCPGCNTQSTKTIARNLHRSDAAAARRSASARRQASATTPRRQAPATTPRRQAPVRATAVRPNPPVVVRPNLGARNPVGVEKPNRLPNLNQRPSGNARIARPKSTLPGVKSR